MSENGSDNLLSSIVECETLFQNLLNFSSDGVLVFREDGKILKMNDIFRHLLNLDLTDFSGRSIWEIGKTDQTEMSVLKQIIPQKLRIRELLLTKEPLAAEAEIQFYDGKKKLHVFRHQLIPVKSTIEPVFILIVTDISTTKHSELTTRILHQISHAINVTDSLDDLYRLIHEALSQILDVTNFYIAQYDKKSNIITFPYIVDKLDSDNSPVESDDSNSLTAQLMKEGKTLLLNEREIIKRTKISDKKPTCKNWLGIPLIMTGEVNGAIVLQSYDNENQYDEDDRLLLESISEHIAYALKKKSADESITVLLQAIEQAGEGIVIFTPEGFIRYVNTIFEKITGFNRNELLDKPFEFLPFEPSAKDEMQRQWVRVRSSQPWHGKIEMVRKDNQRITLDMVVKPVIDFEGKLSSIIASCNDITYQILRDEQQRRVQKLEAIGRLTGGIAHDFNNILSAIIGYTELAGDNIEPDSDPAKNLTEVLKSASRAKEMIQHLISFSRQEESKTEVMDFIEHTKEASRFLRSYLPRSVLIEEKYLIDKVSVQAVPGQMHQILINLGTNAMHAMKNESGTIQIEVDTITFTSKDLIAFPELDQCQYVRLKVQDDGCGIDRSIIDRIFDPYFTTKAASLGTGLGLAIVHNIVQSHHGAIRVVSAPGKGTNFIVLLPINSTYAWPPIAVEAMEEDNFAGSENIMFVDDEPMLVNVFCQGLMKLGYNAKGFTDPRKALDYFINNLNAVDLVITDTTMPHINGIELSVNMLNRKPDLPIILCTGFTTLISAEEAAKKGIRDFIMKPFKTKDLAARIRHLMDSLKK